MRHGRWKHRNGLFYVLLCTLVGVWGSVVYRFGDGGVEEVASTPVVAPADSVRAPALVRGSRLPVFEDEVRDPFARPAELFRADTGSVSGAVAAAGVLATVDHEPPFTLRGVVGSLALVQQPESVLVFAKAGESVAGARILDVQPDFVVTRIEERADTLWLSTAAHLH